jgi:diguanylate cyclase (GGDEF)-like protein/PAS domain S-box-containing protein
VAAVDRALRSRASTICRTLGWSLGAAWRHDRKAGVLACAAVWNETGTPLVGEFAAASLEQRFERGRGLPGYVWATGAPAWLSDVVWDPRMASKQGASRAGLQSAVALPLGVGSSFEGVIELFSEDRREPDAELLMWLTVIASQVAQYLARWETLETLAYRDRALAAAVNGVVIADATEQGFPIVYANRGFERITGYSAEDIAGRPCSVLQGADTDPEAIARLREAITAKREIRETLLNVRKDGTPFWNEVFLSPVFDDEGRLVEYIGVQNDVTDTRVAQDQAEYLAFHDSLTGLANRALLSRVLHRSVDRARHQDRQVALVFLDLDRFKEVNDAHGHAAGDELLRAVAQRLQSVVRPGDLLARQGGDEFALVMGDLESRTAASDALAVAEKVRGALAEPVEIAGQPVAIRCSFGVSVLGRDAADADALLRHADIAMYRAKRAGGGSVRLYRATGTQHPELEAADGAPAAPPVPVEAFDAAMAAVRSVYQPIIDLDTGDVVAFEALARGPEGSSLERPDLLFAAARELGRLDELDWACRGAAVRGALDAGLQRPVRLFVNVEPESLAMPLPEELSALWTRAGEELDVIVEITERALTARPADLLRAVADVRARGWGVALDDVGADVRSLALMPLLQPDVIKLDLRLVHDHPTTEIAEIVSAVNAERERTGAVVLAEGIETAEQLETARAMGATLGQGWHFGRPGPLEPPATAPRQPLEVARAVPVLTEHVSPYELVREHRPVRRGDKRLLIALSLQLEHQAAALGESALIVSAFQSDERFTELTRRRYTLLGADAAFVAALGVGMDAEPAPGVRGSSLDEDDPLTGEWSVAVLGPHFAAALVAVDLGDTGPEMERRFDFALTYDRDLVIEAASALMRRVHPLGG